MAKARGADFARTAAACSGTARTVCVHKTDKTEGEGVEEDMATRAAAAAGPQTLAQAEMATLSEEVEAGLSSDEEEDLLFYERCSDSPVRPGPCRVRAGAVYVQVPGAHAISFSPWQVSTPLVPANGDSL